MPVDLENQMREYAQFLRETAGVVEPDVITRAATPNRPASHRWGRPLLVLAAAALAVLILVGGVALLLDSADPTAPVVTQPSAPTVPAPVTESFVQRDLWARQHIDTYHLGMYVEGVPGVDFEETDGIVTEDGCRVEGQFRVTVEDNRVTELRDHMYPM
jgi:hypothetical protein